MRIYDFKQAQKVNFFIANSKEVALRIEKFYRRNSKVIYPPVEIQEEFKEGEKKYYLTGGRMTYAKNFDLVIKTFNKLKLPLKIYGDGILKKDLEKIANKNIEFVGKITDSELIKLYINAKAFVLAQKDEDFGITCVEAQGCGCPVIAYKGGGYLESVIENKTGVFFDELGVDSLVETIKRFEKTKFDSKECIKNAKRFNKERFREEMLQFINEKFEKS